MNRLMNYLANWKNNKDIKKTRRQIRKYENRLAKDIELADSMSNQILTASQAIFYAVQDISIRNRLKNYTDKLKFARERLSFLEGELQNAN